MWESFVQFLEVLQYLAVIGGVIGVVYWVGKREQELDSGISAAKEGFAATKEAVKELKDGLVGELKDLRGDIRDILTVQATHGVRIEHLETKLSESKP